MDPNTFEQETVDRSLFGDQAVYLKEGCDASLNFHQDTVVSGEVMIVMSVGNAANVHAVRWALLHSMTAEDCCR